MAGLGNLKQLVSQSKQVASGTSTQKIITVDTDKLLAVEQVRENFDDEKIQELAQSLKEHGQIQPIIVWPANAEGLYKIKYGERRWRAAKLAELQCNIVVDYQDMSEAEFVLRQLAENIQREELTLMEFARALKTLKEKHGLKQTQLAKEFNKSDKFISNMISISDLPECVLEVYDHGVTKDIEALVALKKLHNLNPSRCEIVCSAGLKNGIDRKQVLSFYEDESKTQKKLEADKNRPKGMTLGNQEKEAEAMHMKDLKESGLDEESEIVEKDVEGSEADEALESKVVEEEKTTTKKETKAETSKKERGWEPRSNIPGMQIICTFTENDEMKRGYINLERMDHDNEYIWLTCWIPGKKGGQGRKTQKRILISELEIIGVDH